MVSCVGNSVFIEKAFMVLSCPVLHDVVWPISEVLWCFRIYGLLRIVAFVFLSDGKGVDGMPELVESGFDVQTFVDFLQKRLASCSREVTWICLAFLGQLAFAGQESSQN